MSISAQAIQPASYRPHKSAILAAMAENFQTRPSRITIPDHCHPLTKVVFMEMKRQNVTYDELEWRAGVLKSSFKAWRRANTPGLTTVEAALGALGHTLVPVPRLDRLPPHVREIVEEIGQHFRSDEETLGACILAAAEWPAYARIEQAKLTKLAPGSLPAIMAGATSARLFTASGSDSPAGIQPRPSLAHSTAAGAPCPALAA